MSKYHTNKKTYYINLRLKDGIVVQTGEGTNKLVIEWNNINLKQNLSKNALMGLVQFCQFGGDNSVSNYPFIIRCKQVINDQYDSSGNTGAIIYMGNNLNQSYSPNMYPVSTQNLDTITLSINRGVENKFFGISNTIQMYVQLKVIDYDTEEVNPKLMPEYTSKSLSYHVPNSSI